MKISLLYILIATFLASCVAKIDEQGNWTLMADPEVIALGFDYLVKEKKPSPEAKSAEWVWAYQLENGTWVDENGSLIPDWNQ